MSRSGKCILIALLSLSLASCSRPKTISREALHSDLLAAISLASETELFINQMQEGRFTPALAESTGTRQCQTRISEKGVAHVESSPPTLKR
jgi:hypothetical protein